MHASYFQPNETNHTPLLHRSKIIKIGTTRNGSPYGIIDTSENPNYPEDSLIFYDSGVRGDGVVADFKHGDLVEYGTFQTPTGRIVGSQVAHPTNYTNPIMGESPKAMHNLTRKRFKDFVYIPYRVFPLIEIALDEQEASGIDESPKTKDEIFGRIARYYNTYGAEAYSREENGCILLKTGLKSFRESTIALKCIASPDPRNEWLCTDVIIDGAPIESIRSTVKLSWYAIEEDLSELSQTAEKSTIESIQTQIEKVALHHRDKLIWLNHGSECAEHEADALYIPTGFFADGEISGKELYLHCTRNNQHGTHARQPWVYQTVVFENAPLKYRSRNSLLSLWAILADDEHLLEGVFSELAKTTLPEPWAFDRGPEYGILKNYLNYTFVRQYLSNAINYSADKRYAAFNTGLPDRYSLEYIYALFEKTKEQNTGCHPLHYQCEYKLLAFTRAGSGGAGKTLTGNIKPLPAPPRYFSSRSAMVWDLEFSDNNQITVPDFDDQHILITRCNRIPLDFYRSTNQHSKALASILDNHELKDGEKYSEIQKLFLPIIHKTASDEIAETYEELRIKLKNCIERALKQLSWNWRSVVPSYNPSKRNEGPSFLLPISFANGSKEPDRALIATATKMANGETAYQIHTVIPLQWAYLSARLVCRPETEWLNLASLSGEDD